MSRLSLLTGTAGTVVVPSGMVVRSVRTCAPSSGGTLVIMTSDETTLETITIPEKATGWLELDFHNSLGELKGGSMLDFTGTDAFVVVLQVVGGLS